MDSYFNAAVGITNGKRAFNTRKWYIGVVSLLLISGDFVIVVVVHGAHVPFLLRRQSDRWWGM